MKLPLIHSGFLIPDTLGILAGILILSLVLNACRSTSKTSDDKQWDVYALEYGHSVGFRMASLVRGAKGNRPISWYALLLRGHGRTVLIDTGFQSRELAKKWKFDRFEPVPELLRRMDISPGQVTDVIVTHAHFDHVGNLAPFLNALVWVQKREMDWATKRVDKNTLQKEGIRFKDILSLQALRSQGRLKEIDGSSQIINGIDVHLGGGHTRHIQWVEINTGKNSEPLIFASDIAYLYENIERQIPPGASTNPESDLAQIQMMRSMVKDPARIIPGHDPMIMESHTEMYPNIAKIE